MLVSALAYPIGERAALQITGLKTVYMLGGYTLSERALWYGFAGVLVVVLVLFFGAPVLLSTFSQIRQQTSSLGSSLPPPEVPPVSTPQPTTATATEVPVPSPTVVPPGLARIRITDVNLRRGPGSNTSSMAVLRRGSVVEVLSDVQPFEENLWVRIRVGDQYGWVNQRYLLPGGPSTGFRARVSDVMPDALRLRSEPSQRAEIIDKLTEETEVEVLEAQRRVGGITWQRVRIDDQEGWVDKSYLQPIP
ncbi:MAG: hypothetical protein OHK0022_30030 [Roseiflexaceae bacterium]